MSTHPLLEIPISDCVVPVPNSIVDLLCIGAKEILFDQSDVEALTTLEGIEPFSPDATHVQQQGILPFFCSFLG